MISHSSQIIFHACYRAVPHLPQCNPDNIGAYDHVSDALATAHDMVFMLNLCFYGGFMPAAGEPTLLDLTECRHMIPHPA